MALLGGHLCRRVRPRLRSRRGVPGRPGGGRVCDVPVSGRSLGLLDLVTTMPAHLAADAHAVRCPSCARDVPEGNFCEHCGASLLAQPDPEVAEATPEIAKATLEVKFLSIAAFGAEDADMGMRLSRV